MALDFTYNIRKRISPIANDPEVGTRGIEIHALDNLDEHYLIRTKDSDGMWMNFLKSPLWVEHLYSPEKGVIEVTVRKNYPKYHDCEDEEQFLKDVAAYFTDLFGGGGIFTPSFRMRVEPVMDEVTTAIMKHNDEGDEIGWEEHDVNVCVGAVYTLYGPTDGDALAYSIFDEDRKAFILRKLEAIFDKKGAYCHEIPCKELFLGEQHFHYEFTISDYF